MVVTMKFKKGDKVIFKRMPNEWYNENGFGKPSTYLTDEQVYEIVKSRLVNTTYKEYYVIESNGRTCSVFLPELTSAKPKVPYLPEWL